MIPESYLGKKLKDYLLQEYNTNETLSKAAVRHLGLAITTETILINDNVTAAVLHNLIRLPLDPMHLILLRGTRIIPRLMKLFRRYCRAHKPFEYEFGFHCIEAIMFALGIGLLAEADGLSSYVVKAQTMAKSGPKPTRSFHVLLEESLGPIFRTNETPEDEKYFLWGLDDPKQRLAPLLGGFTMDDIRYIVETFNGPPRFTVDRLTELLNIHSRDDTLFYKLGVVAFRLELGSLSHKYDVLDRVIRQTDSTIDRPDAEETMNVVDQEDAKLVLTEYYRYITFRQQRNWRTVPLCAARTISFVQRLNDFESLKEYITSHIGALWTAELLLAETLPGTNPEDYIKNRTDLVTFGHAVVLLIGGTLVQAQPEHQIPLSSLLFTSGDFANLMGRLFLSFSRPPGNPELIEQTLGE
ncbi:hypothetical protein FRC09_013759 [Ceratobasidium sp. 395]|nr:hypothetical protein FRC09_013759 [Ceratobasidium sp. 395]